MTSIASHQHKHWWGNSYYFAGLVSFLLSFWVSYHEVIINPDAICYLQSAGIVGDGGLRKAMSLCSQAQWPFYSVLIYFFSTITYLPAVNAAYALDALFSAITVLMFIRIVQELGGSKRVVWLAVFVVLLANEFNSVRQYIIRDHGYWAFYLVSIFLLLRYFSTGHGYYAFTCSASLLIATLFRIEGTLFIILLPFLVWLHPSFSRWKKIIGFFQLNLLAFSSALAIFGWLIFHPEISLASLGRLQEFVFQLFHAGGMIWQRLQTSMNGFTETVLAMDTKSEATIIFLLVLAMWYLVKIIVNLSPLYSVLALYGFWNRAAPLTQSNLLVLKGYLLVNVIITSFFFAEHLSLSKHYLIALSLTLMLWVPFTLDKLITKWRAKNISFATLFLVVILILINSVGGLFNFGYSKAYIRNAGNWLAENVPVDAELYANDYQLMYYSNHFGNEIFQKLKEYREVASIMQIEWRNYDYLAIKLGKNEQQALSSIIKKIAITPIQIFSNDRGDQVLIYKVESADSI